MALPGTDTFTGTNGATLQTYSANWTDQTHPAKIQNNGVQGDASSYSTAFWSADVFNADQYSQAIYLSGTCGVVVRASGSDDFYMLDCNDSGGTTSRIYKHTSGGFTQIGSDLGVTWSNGNGMKLDATGTGTVTLKAYKDTGGGYAQVGSDCVDASSPLNSGSAGVMALTAGGAATLDNWEGGNIGGGVGGGTTTPFPGGMPLMGFQ